VLVYSCEYKVLRVSPVAKIWSYCDFDVHPYYSHMSKLDNRKLSHINSSLPHHLLIFASSMPPVTAEERQRQLTVAYLLNVVGIAILLLFTLYLSCKLLYVIAKVAAHF
jgi:hypothetical protein